MPLRRRVRSKRLWKRKMPGGGRAPKSEQEGKGAVVKEGINGHSRGVR